jgi:hypothetical protein
VAVGKVAAHLCLIRIIKELKISVERDRGGNNTKYNQTLNILFSVVDEIYELRLLCTITLHFPLLMNDFTRVRVLCPCMTLNCN